MAGDSSVPRPQADHVSPIGTQRYRLLKAAFAHAQRAIRDGHYLEAITILESLIGDRLGSLVGGSLGHAITLRHTISGIAKIAKTNSPVADQLMANGAPRAPFPTDVLLFITDEVLAWWDVRNEAVHGMAKLRQVDDAPFAERYAALSFAATEGVRILQKLDMFDSREKARNGAGRSATWPDALALDPDNNELTADVSAAAR
jgi:hypothetical protein